MPPTDRPAGPWLAAAVAAAWLLPGLAGHDPWKPDEAYSFGLVRSVLRTGDLVVPAIAGEPFLEKPPLVYVTGALAAGALSPVLPLHDGARVAAGLYVGLALAFVGLAARELYGRGRGRVAVLLLAGCLGLPYRGHQLIADTGLLAGFAAALYGLALARRRTVLGGFWLGTGAGAAFLAKGLLGPGVLALAALALPLLGAEWRSRRHAASLLVAAAAAAPWVVPWTVALHIRSPALFDEWLVANNIGRFTGTSGRGPAAHRLEYLASLLWFAFPALPLAAAALAAPGRRRASILIPLAAGGILLAALLASATARDLYLLPLLLPLALLGSEAADRLPPRLDRALARAFVAAGGLAAAGAWMAWLAVVAGQPAPLARALAARQPVRPGFGPGAFLVGAAATAAWAILARTLLRSRPAALLAWTSGVALAWLLAMTLLLPWMDAGNSYRSVVASLSAALPAAPGPIASEGLGEGERAMLEYFGGIRTRRVEAVGRIEPDCDLLIVQRRSWIAEPPAGVWALVREASRPGNRRESFALYARARPASPTP